MISFKLLWFNRLSLSKTPQQELFTWFRWATRQQLWIRPPLFVSFLSLNRPPLALGRLQRSHFTVQAIWTSQRRGQFHGNWVWSRQCIKKNEQGRLFQCLKAAGGLFNGCPTVTHTHTLTTQSQTPRTSTAMHWCIGSHMHTNTSTQAVNSG